MKKIIALLMVLTLGFSAVGCQSATSSTTQTNETTTTTQTQDSQEDAEKPETWIADRVIKGLVFQSAGDASVEMNPEIAAYIKERTGITLELEGITGSSKEALAAGLAAGDLPDFIAFYLNHSGRPEMKLLLKAANEGQFTDLMPFFTNDKYTTYSKYLQDGYLPEDTKNNIMYRDDWHGKSYLVHMSINRNPAQISRKYVGGPYIKKSIADELDVDPQSITTSEQVYELAKQIQEHDFKDDNGVSVTPIGPTAWGGKDRQYLYNDLVFTGAQDEKFYTENGEVKHEAMTEIGLTRIQYIQKIMAENLMHPEFYTMEENRAKEGIVNGSFGIVADMHNYLVENNDMTYVPLGPINRYDGYNNMVVNYKSGYAGWAIPSTTENPEEIFAFADWLASEEGKRLYFYGLEGRDYDLVDGKPVAKADVLDLKEQSPDEAKKLGFRGVRAYWGEHLGYTDLDSLADFGESEYGQKNESEGEEITTAEKILEIWNFDQRYSEADIVDGMTAKAFLGEFDPKGKLEKALDRYDEDIIRAYYEKDIDAAKAIMEDSKANLMNNGLQEFCDFLEEKIQQGVKIKF